MIRLALPALLSFAAACHSAPKATPAPLDAGATADARLLHLDPALITSHRVETAPIERRAPRDRLLLPAEVLADEAGSGDATTMVAGRVASLEVADGQHVERGAVLAWVDAPEAVRAAADVLRSRGRAEQTSRLLVRQLELAKENATSQSALDDARANDAAAQADVLAARTLIRSYGGSEPSTGQTNARVAVRAPIAGLVAERFTTLGSPVTPDKPLFHLVAPERVYVLAKLPETSAYRPTVGAAVVVQPREIGTGDGAAKRCSAKVVSVLDVVDLDRQRRVRVALDAPHECTGVTVGRYVDVGFDTSARADIGLVAPKEAVVEVKGAQLVFVDHGNGTFEARTVRVRARTESEVDLEDGVADGDRVVAKGALLLKGELLRAELATE